MRTLLKEAELRIVSWPSAGPESGWVLMTAISLDGDVAAHVDTRWLKAAESQEVSALLAEHAAAVTRQLAGLRAGPVIKGIVPAVRTALVTHSLWDPLVSTLLRHTDEGLLAVDGPTVTGLVVAMLPRRWLLLPVNWLAKAYFHRLLLAQPTPASAG